MERLTKYVTPVGMVMTSLNSMKHYMPCVPCRHRAEIKYKDGKGYTEEFSFCGTCEVKMLFNKLKEYEDLEEQGLLLRLPCKVGDTLYYISDGFIKPCTVETIFISDYTDKDGNCSYMAEIHFDREDCPYVSTEIYFTDIGKTVFLTKEEAEKKLNEMSK